MEEYQNLHSLIKLFGDSIFFVGRADDTRVAKIESMLSVKLPNSYIWFLKHYGHGGVPGVEILGNGLAEIPSCVRASFFWQKNGLPTNFVVIEDSGADYVVCLDTSRVKNGECPVVDWEYGVGVGKWYYETFFDYLAARLKESFNLQ
ncbi:MAG: hypothetical protein BGO78_14010 [Chloroflexi bacterium 44-23]|nr:MAG: hypothetical protein BGO78_14010 [Chloroflexi bacterium 44-23]